MNKNKKIAICLFSTLFAILNVFANFAVSISPIPSYGLSIHSGFFSGMFQKGIGNPIYNDDGTIHRPAQYGFIDSKINIKKTDVMVDWDKTTGELKLSTSSYNSEFNKFYDAAHRPLVNEWIGVLNEDGNITWYFSDIDGKIAQDSFMSIGDGVYYFYPNGIMATGLVIYKDVSYYFFEDAGPDRGKLIPFTWYVDMR